MIERPLFKNYVKNYEDYLINISDFIKKTPKNLLAKIDLLRFYSRSRRFDEFEKLSLELQDTRNSLIEREIGRFYLFAKNDTATASKHFLKAIEINHEEPMWVYYFSGKTFNYYEKLHDNLLYTAIPKNASTSLKNFVLDKVYQTPEKNPHSQFGNPFFKSQQFSEIELSSSKKVLVIREPIERIKSYFNKNISETDSLSFELGTTNREMKDFYGLPTQPTFEFFLQNIWDYCLVFNDVLHHILPQSAYVNSLQGYDVIEDIKSLDSLVQQVSECLNIEYNGPAPRKMLSKNKNNSTIETSSEDLFLKTIYFDDYILLQKFYDIPNEIKFKKNQEISFNPASTVEQVSLCVSNQAVSNEDIKALLNLFFRKDIQALNKIALLKSKFNLEQLDAVFESFNEFVNKDSIHIAFDSSLPEGRTDFEMAIILKIREGINEVQDQMLKESRLSICINGQDFYSDKTLILGGHLFAYPFIIENNCYFVFFTGFRSQIVSIYDVNHNSYVSFIYLITQKPSADRVLASKICVKSLLQHIFDLTYELFSYISKPSTGRNGCFLAALHMAHSLWNDYGGLERLEREGLIRLIKLFVVLRGAESYGLLENKFNIHKDLSLVRYSRLYWKEQVANCYYNNLFWLRITDNFVSDNLAKRILNSQPHGKSYIYGEELTVTFGFRLENRTWVNQREGWVEIIRYLVRHCNKLTIVVDGHNTSEGATSLISAGETKAHSIVDQEKELAEYLRVQNYEAPVEFINYIGMTLAESLNAINHSDFFIAPWGAGLAKYRWVCNLPGIVMTADYSRLDLRIYDTLEYRENAVESVFLDSQYITDVGDDSVVVKSKVAGKNNFKVNINGLIQTLEKLLTDLRHTKHPKKLNEKN